MFSALHVEVCCENALAFTFDIGIGIGIFFRICLCNGVRIIAYTRVLVLCDIGITSTPTVTAARSQINRCVTNGWIRYVQQLGSGFVFHNFTYEPVRAVTLP